MKFDDVVTSRRSIRKYLDKDVSFDDINKIVEFGILAPSAHNRQPWKVKIVRGEEKDKIVTCLREKTELDGSINNTALVIEQAPVLLVLFYDGDSVNRDHDILSIGAFMENMHLKATELGLGSLWIANTDYIKEEISVITGCRLECVSCLSVGYKDQDPKMRPRKSLEEIIVK